VNRLFPLPFSFNTSAHRIFCWSFYSGHSLNKWPRWNGVEKERLDVRKVDLELREFPGGVEASLLVLSATAPSGFWLFGMRYFVFEVRPPAH